jgi:hypothetical protein
VNRRDIATRQQSRDSSMQAQGLVRSQQKSITSYPSRRGTIVSAAAALRYSPSCRANIKVSRSPPSRLGTRIQRSHSARQPRCVEPCRQSRINGERVTLQVGREAGKGQQQIIDAAKKPSVSTTPSEMSARRKANAGQIVSNVLCPISIAEQAHRSRDHRGKPFT